MVDLLLGEILLSSLIVTNTPNINVVNYIETEENKYDKVVTPVDSALGTGVYVAETEKIYYSTGSSKPSSYSQKILYKYPHAISAPVVLYQKNYLSMYAGSSVSLTYSETASKSSTYSVEISTSVNETLGSSFKLETGIGIVKAEESASISLGFELESKESIEDTYTTSTTREQNITFYIKEDGNYILERRAMFDVYIVEYVTGVYDVKMVGNKLSYTNTVKYYTIQTSYILSYIKGTDSIGFYKYNWNTLTNKYQIDQESTRRLFGSNSLNFID